MKVVHVGWYNSQPVGGVGKTILAQTAVLHSMGYQVEIWNFTPDVTEPRIEYCSAPFAVWQIPARSSQLGRCLLFSPSAKKWIYSRIAEVQSFHIHSVFIPENALIARLGKPYILTPNGGWSDIVLDGRRRFIKKIWIFLIESRMWSSASFVQAVCSREAKQLAKLSRMGPIEVIPNGTDIPDDISDISERDCFLYMGRLDIYQKGLDVLFEALKIVKSKNIEIPKLILAGPDYRNGRAHLEKFIDQNQLSGMVEFKGVVHGVEKDFLFRRARLFIHTSRWEGLPLVLLEALAYGIPCLLTPGTNVSREWADAGCAFETEMNASAIADSLIRLSNQDLKNESRLARLLAMSDYSWESIGVKLSNLYNAASLPSEKPQSK